jgi:hypothetical protein
MSPKSKRELIEPHAGDKRYVRRKANGTFSKTVDVQITRGRQED